MTELLICAFCKTCDGPLLFFKEETLKKCQAILKQRKIHNLKYKDVVLPDRTFESGYHRHCYKSFTGLMKKYYSEELVTTQKCSQTDKSFENDSSTSNLATILIPEVVISSDLPELISSNSEGHSVQPEYVADFPNQSNLSYESINMININKKICIFCNKKIQLKRLPLYSCEKNNFLNKLHEDNEALTELIEKVKNCIYSKIYYHGNCQKNFSYKTLHKKTNWHNIHQTVFDEMCVFIHENVIKRGRCFFLTYLQRYYMELFKEKEDSEKIKQNLPMQNLESEIVKAFDKEIKFLTIQNKRLLAPKHLTTVDEQLFKNLRDEDILHKAALILRKSVLQAEKKKLPNNISVRYLQQGEVSVPQNLLEFYYNLIAGSNSKRKNNPKCMHQVQSFSEDVVYGLHNGKFRTSKHIKLGMTLKRLTSSRKVIDILHKHGHCISYPGVVELETETNSFSKKKSTLFPEAIKKTIKCNNDTIDNFDWTVKMEGGKNIHNTVRTVCQNGGTPDECEVQNLPSTSSQGTTELRKKSWTRSESVDEEVEPFLKQLMMIDPLSNT